MLKKIIMPAAGQTTDVATVTSIMVKVGEKVHRGDIIMEVESDKATLPIESVASGYVCRICVEEYEKIDAGTLLMEIGDENDLKAAENAAGADDSTCSADADKPADESSDAVAGEEKEETVPETETKTEAKTEAETESKENPETKPAEESGTKPAAKTAETTVSQQHESGTGAYSAMPAAKKAAAELGVDLSLVTASNGKFIKKSDVEAFAKSQCRGYENGYRIPGNFIPTSIMRDTLASKLEKFAAFTQNASVEVSAEAALRLYRASKATPGDLVILALSRLCDRFPVICARYEKNILKKTDGCVFGLAYTGLNGMVSAACQQVESKKLGEVRDVNRANIELLSKGDMSPCLDCSLTVFDLSDRGIDSLVPTVQQPEVLSVSIGGIKKRPCVNEEGTLSVRNSFVLTVAYDARAIDAPVACELLSQLASLVADPALML